ncbi:unnamed protein product [Polarella glacialis]|uniref:Uncharacterized protein n=1 Tax=Polarella glacialis TaxID=89957 RepID=A0A813L203_POLGL|nr:unnamed protein product [Polarella glacialis]
MEERAESLCAAAELYLDNGDFELAAQAARDSLSAGGGPGGSVLALRLLVLAQLGSSRAVAEVEQSVADVLEASGGNTAGGEKRFAALFAELELRCAAGQLDEALQLALQLRTLGSDLAISSGTSQLQAAALVALVKVQSSREALDEAMRASMELLAAAQKRRDRGAEADAWRVIAEVHALRENSSGKATASTPEETLQAAERAAQLYSEACPEALGGGFATASPLVARLRHGWALALIEVARARFRLGRLRDAAAAAGEAVSMCRELGRVRCLLAALEVAVQAHSALHEPLLGLRAANQELQWLREGRGSSSGSGGSSNNNDNNSTRSSRAAEAQLLELIATTHSQLSEPLGALRSARLAAELRQQLGDSQGEASALLLAAEQQRLLGEMAEATRSAELAVTASRAAGDAAGEERALQLLSRLLVERGLSEQAPQRPQALQTLQDLVRAVELRDTAAVKDAEERLNGYGGLVTNKDIADHLVPIFTRDRGSVEFLRELGWEFDQNQTGSTKIKMIPHESFYMGQIMNGMNFGPQFRVVNPFRVSGPEPVAISVCQLPETEAWQMELGFPRPGFLDAGLQSSLVHMFPE